MELLLNLAWLLLVLPAYWVWRKRAGAYSRRTRANRVSSAQCFWALGCALVLLFPVVSASDDLHAMRAEMEESASSKRAVRTASSDRTSAWTNRRQSPPAALANAYESFIAEFKLLEVSNCSVPSLTDSGVAHAGRAPPYSLLG